jgi:hypothetical protein
MDLEPPTSYQAEERYSVTQAFGQILTEDAATFPSGAKTSQISPTTPRLDCA